LINGEIKINFFKTFTDLFLLLFSYLATFFLKRGNLNLGETYLSFIPLLILCWFLSGIFTSKFRDSEEVSLEPYSFSALYFTGLLALLIFGLELYNLSRFIVFGTISIYLLLEIFIVSGLLLPVFVKKEEGEKKYSLILILSEMILIAVSFFSIHYIKLNTTVIRSDIYFYILISIYFLWFFIALFTHKFILELSTNFLSMIAPFMRSYFIILSLFSAVIFGFRIEGLSRLLIFGTVIAYALLELFIFFSIFMYRFIQKSDIPEINVFEAPLIHEDIIVKEIIKRESVRKGKYSISGKRKNSKQLYEKLSKVYLPDSLDILEFIDKAVDLRKIDIVKSEVMDTGNPYNVNILPDDSLELLMNFHELNSFRNLNKYLISVNRIINNGGVFVGKFEPMERRYYYFKNKYPAFFAKIFYTFDFLWRRIFPKVPILNKLYFMITKGRRRVFSMAEGLGRLYYCGFEIISLKEIENFVWFIVNKVNCPLRIIPSYALFFKQKRVGRNGKSIFIYKVRTMHPFSEFIHKYIYDRNKLDEKGKIKDDFRITSWGRVFRKFWIDEIPMVINWIKGDLKLIGVRPLSETFFNTYPDDLKEERVLNKPGLIPPYYADMPGSIEEVWDSERKYLRQFKKNPFKTDWSYFWKAVKNIVIKGAKSS